ncbi:hypothetical protein HYQ46_009406 [Verticillium longisporum]|nr:hypothetical protein HYQ46_009406 [Verticillium longisporum]
MRRGQQVGIDETGSQWRDGPRSNLDCLAFPHVDFASQERPMQLRKKHTHTCAGAGAHSPPSKDRDPRIYEAQQPPNDNASMGSDSVTAVLAGRAALGGEALGLDASRRDPETSGDLPLPFSSRENCVLGRSQPLLLIFASPTTPRDPFTDAPTTDG